MTLWTLNTLLQEPDNQGIRWEPADGKPGYGPLYLSLMDAVNPILPEALFVVEGTSQYSSDLTIPDSWHANSPLKVWACQVSLCTVFYHNQDVGFQNPDMPLW
jgi:hypothetical protein